MELPQISHITEHYLSTGRGRQFTEEAPCGTQRLSELLPQSNSSGVHMNPEEHLSLSWWRKAAKLAPQERWTSSPEPRPWSRVPLWVQRSENGCQPFCHILPTFTASCSGQVAASWSHGSVTAERLKPVKSAANSQQEFISLANWFSFSQMILLVLLISLRFES